MWNQLVLDEVEIQQSKSTVAVAYALLRSTLQHCTVCIGQQRMPGLVDASSWSMSGWCCASLHRCTRNQNAPTCTEPGATALLPLVYASHDWVDAVRILHTHSMHYIIVGVPQLPAADARTKRLLCCKKLTQNNMLLDCVLVVSRPYVILVVLTQRHKANQSNFTLHISTGQPTVAARAAAALAMAALRLRFLRRAS